MEVLGGLSSQSKDVPDSRLLNLWREGKAEPLGMYSQAEPWNDWAGKFRKIAMSPVYKQT